MARTNFDNTTTTRHCRRGDRHARRKARRHARRHEYNEKCLPAATPTMAPLPVNEQLHAFDMSLPMYAQGLLTEQEHLEVLRQLNLIVGDAIKEFKGNLRWLLLLVVGAVVMLVKTHKMRKRYLARFQAVLDEANARLERSGRAIRYCLADNHTYIYLNITPQEALISGEYRQRMAMAAATTVAAAPASAPIPVAVPVLHSSDVKVGVVATPAVDSSEPPAEAGSAVVATAPASAVASDGKALL